MIAGLDIPLTGNLFGFKNDSVSHFESNTSWSNAIKKLNAFKSKSNLKSDSYFAPSPLTGDILVMEVTEAELLKFAQCIKAKHRYDHFSKIGYLTDF